MNEPDQFPVPLYLDRAQVAQFIGLGETETEAAFRDLPNYHASARRVRVSRDALIAWMESRRVETAA